MLQFDITWITFNAAVWYYSDHFQCCSLILNGSLSMLHSLILHESLSVLQFDITQITFNAAQFDITRITFNATQFDITWITFSAAVWHYTDHFQSCTVDVDYFQFWGWSPVSSVMLSLAAEDTDQLNQAIHPLAFRLLHANQTQSPALLWGKCDQECSDKIISSCSAAG